MASLITGLVKAILTNLGQADNTQVELRTTQRHALWVASDNQVGEGVGAIDLSSADVSFADPGIRQIRVTTGGTLKIDCPGLDGVDATGVTITVLDGELVTCRRILKVYKVGTTAVGLVGYR